MCSRKLLQKGMQKVYLLALLHPEDRDEYGLIFIVPGYPIMDKLRYKSCSTGYYYTGDQKKLLRCTYYFILNFALSKALIYHTSRPSETVRQQNVSWTGFKYPAWQVQVSWQLGAFWANEGWFVILLFFCFVFFK